MNRHNQGFSHIALVLVVVIIVVIGLVAYRVLNSQDNKEAQNQPQSTQTTQNATKAQAAEADIALKNFGLKSMDDVLFSPNATRDFASNGLKGFYVFGDSLSGGRINPNFEFSSVKPDAQIVAAIDGIIGFVREQPETKDFEVFLQPKENSAWTIGYDHLVNVKLKQGDTVKAGDVLGAAAVQNNGLNRFEIQINKDVDGQTTHYCPSTLLAADVKDTLLADLKAMQEKWESQTGLELYDLAAQNPVGCYKVTTLTPAQAEGR